VRIVGGDLRGRLLAYDGDPRTRPMKDRTREAVFNLLRNAVAGTHAIDLFAGTGALGLEALSRGAARATFLERHAAAARTLRENVTALNVQDRVQVLSTDTFRWARGRLESLPQDLPWLVFCSPPYDFYTDRAEEMLALVNQLFAAAPAGSFFVIEADRRFDITRLPNADWDVRRYPPAVIAIGEKVAIPFPNERT
jgi:16S rRNA (guanine(966)-N(2))-methyltransferase RsmD